MLLTYQPGLDFINQTRPVRFKWDIRDGQPGQGKQGTTNYGFIAQELLEINNDIESQFVFAILFMIN